MADTNTIQGLHQRAEEIRYAHLSQDPEGSNSDERVGSLLVDIVDLLGSGSGDLGTFLSTLNSSSALNDATPGSGQTIVYNGAWGFGDAGGGGGSFPAGSVLASLLQNGSSPGTILEAGYVIKWDGTKWVYGEGGTGGDISSCLTKTAYAASKFWGQSPTLTSGANPHYEVTGPLSGGIEYIEFSNGVRIGVNSNSDDSTIKVYRENTIDPTTQEPVTHVGHIYATGGVSALGNSSGGGGGGGGGLTSGHWAEFFDGIIHPSGTESGKNGKYLMLTVDGSDNISLSWTTPAGSLPSMTGHEGDYLKVINNGGTLEAAWTSASPGGGLTPGNLAEALDAVSAPTSASTDMYLKFTGTTYTWANPPSAGGGITGVSVPSTGNALTGVSVSQDGTTLNFTKDTFLTQHQDITGKLDSSYFTNALWWGRQLQLDSGIYKIGTSSSHASLDYVQDINMWGNIYMQGGGGQGEGAQIDFGGGSGYNKYSIDNFNGYFRLFCDVQGATSYDMYYFLDQGLLQIGWDAANTTGHAGSAIQIGNVKIINESGNTLKIIGADGNAGNLYATGGISALGLSNGSSPSIGNLTVTDKLTLQSTDNTKGLTFTDGTNTTPLYMNDGNLTVGGSGISFGSGVYANTSGFHATNLYATSVYLQTDPNDVYLYWHVEENNNRLRLVVGTTEYDISTSQVPTS